MEWSRGLVGVRNSIGFRLSNGRGGEVMAQTTRVRGRDWEGAGTAGWLVGTRKKVREGHWSRGAVTSSWCRRKTLVIFPVIVSFLSPELTVISLLPSFPPFLPLWPLPSTLLCLFQFQSISGPLDPFPSPWSFCSITFQLSRPLIQSISPPSSLFSSFFPNMYVPQCISHYLCYSFHILRAFFTLGYLLLSSQLSSCTSFISEPLTQNFSPLSNLFSLLSASQAVPISPSPPLSLFLGSLSIT